MNDKLFYTNRGRLEVASVGSSLISVCSAGADGTKIFSISQVASTTSEIQFYISDGITDAAIFFIDTSSYPIGNNFLLGHTFFKTDKAGNPYINLEPGYSIKAIITSGASPVNIMTYSENY